MKRKDGNYPISRKYKLDDGLQLNRAFPDSFRIPKEEAIKRLNKGDLVKLIFRESTAVERMWVMITSVQNPGKDKVRFIGVLDNTPYELESIKRNDVVKFSRKNIIDIYSDTALR